MTHTHTHTHTRRRSLRLGLGLLILAGAGSMVPTLSAQPGGDGPPGTVWGDVALSECSGCGDPPDTLGCEVEYRSCMRIDDPPVLKAEGTQNVLNAHLKCSNCDGCPENPPLVTLHCDVGGQIAFTQTATASINSQITVGVPGLEAQLGATLGLAIGTTMTVSVNCSADAPPCVEADLRASLSTINGRTASIRHRWWVSGVWFDDVDGADCEFVGHPYSAYCGEGYSTGVANLAGQATCTVTDDPCGVR